MEAAVKMEPVPAVGDRNGPPATGSMEAPASDASRCPPTTRFGGFKMKMVAKKDEKTAAAKRGPAPVVFQKEREAIVKSLAAATPKGVAVTGVEGGGDFEYKNEEDKAAGNGELIVPCLNKIENLSRFLLLKKKNEQQESIRCDGELKVKEENNLPRADRVGGGLIRDLKKAVSMTDNLPDVPSLDQYDALPPEEFGMAMLRGMGYDPKKYAYTKPVEVKKRKWELAGLGAEMLLPGEKELKEKNIVLSRGRRGPRPGGPNDQAEGKGGGSAPPQESEPQQSDRGL